MLQEGYAGSIDQEIDTILAEVDKNGEWVAAAAAGMKHSGMHQWACAPALVSLRSVGPGVSSTSLLLLCCPAAARAIAGDGQIDYDEFVELMTGTSKQAPLERGNTRAGTLNAYKIAHNMGI